MPMHVIRLLTGLLILGAALILNDVCHVPIPGTQFAAVFEFGLVGGFLTMWGAVCL